MKFLFLSFAALCSLFLLSCSEAEKADSNPNEIPGTGEGKTEEQKKAEAETTPMKRRNTDPASGGEEIITLAGGCFWCTEAVLEKIDGVKDVVSGYMGGHVENPTYQQICTKTTGHAEVIQVTFETSKISLDEVLNVFWQAHDPTTLNQQGADRGPQYRSAIFYHSPQQKTIAEQSKTKLDASGIYADPAVTEITEASTFWVAEDYHQDYYQLNGDNRYCQAVIVPKLKKLGLE